MNITQTNSELTTVSNEQITAEILIYKKQTAQGIIEIGNRLIEMKSRLQHGEWENWLKEKVDFTKMTASRFIRIAEQTPNVTTLLHLEPSKVYALLSVPAEERDEFVERKHSVDGTEKKVDEMSTRELQKVIKEKKELEGRLIDLKEKYDQATVDFARQKKEIIYEDNPELLERNQTQMEQITELHSFLKKKDIEQAQLKAATMELEIKTENLERQLRIAEEEYSKLEVEDTREQLKDEIRLLEKDKEQAKMIHDATMDVVDFIQRTKAFIKEEMLFIPTLTVNYQLDAEIQDELITIHELLNDFNTVLKQKFQIPAKRRPEYERESL